MVVKDQFLGKLLGLVGALARRISVDELNFDLFAIRPFDGVAMERLIGFDRLLELAAPGRERAGVGSDQPDLDDIGGGSGDGSQQQHRADESPKQSLHR